MNSPLSNEWLAAIESEHAALEENGTWVIVPKEQMPTGQRALNSKYVFKTKRKADGSVERYKARFCVMGNKQVKDVDYFEVFAPVASRTTIRIFFAIAAAHKLKVHQMDVKSVFLYPRLEEEIYMNIPQGISAPEGSVCRLIKCLYGLKQSSKMWHQELSNYLMSFGLIRSLAEPCMYFLREKNMVVLYIVIYVDDLLILSFKEEHLISFKKNISERFQMTDLGIAKKCLGIRINQSKKCITLNQKLYVKEVLKKFIGQECKPVKTPLPPNKWLRKPEADSKDPNDVFLNNQQTTKYRAVTGCLLYLVACTRPDIALATNMLSRFMHKPTIGHWTAAMHVLRYLKSTAHYSLCYGEGKTLEGYTDASFANEPDSCKSVSGNVFLLNNSAISWRSALQSIVAASTCEAEYVALYSATKECMYLRQLLEEMGIDCASPTIIHEDNQPAIQVAQNHITKQQKQAHETEISFCTTCYWKQVD